MRSAFASNECTVMRMSWSVSTFDAKALRKAVSRAKLPRKLQKRVTYRATPGKFTLVIRGARALGDDHDQNKWVSPILRHLRSAKVRPLFAQL